MRHMVVHGLIAGVLVALGWAAGTAQSGVGDFEMRINAVAGTTNVECVRGCSLIGSRDVRNPQASRMRTYEFSCNSSTGRCQATVVGFLDAKSGEPRR